ncbi:MAG TPA: hypothetical protein VIG06_14185 [Kofleriaceae bacterium]|jgi:hypothetical protein
MSRPFKEWKVLPHEKLTEVADDILTVVGTLRMPLGEFPRRMTVVRLADRRLVIYSAIALDEAEMREIEAYGHPAFLVVPGDIHRLDAHAWKERYPDLFVVAPAGAREKVEKVVRVDATEVDFGDPSVELISVPGTGGHEAALLVDKPTGATLIVNDLIWNLGNQPGVGGWFMRIARFTGTPAHIPPLVARKLIVDRPALGAQLEEWSQIEGLDRIIVSHGDIVTGHPRHILRQLATQLSS